MELQTHGTKKYPTSAFLRSSAGLGWSTKCAELRAHGVSESPTVVPQHCFRGSSATNRLTIALAYYGNELERSEPRQILRV
jgi:hypothetical protein